MTFTPLALLLRTVFAAFPPSISCSYSAMSGHCLLSLRLCRLIAWKSILRRGAVLHTLHRTRHGILFPFPFHTTLCCFSPNRLRRAVQARLCCKRCRHVIGLGPYCLSYDVIPFALAAVWGCPYHDKLPFCHLSLVTLDPTPHLPLVATCSIAWSVHIPVMYISPNTSPSEL